MSNDKKPITPNLMQDTEGIWYICGDCSCKLKQVLKMTNTHIEINMDHFPKYCPACGRPVNYEHS